jgi:hypothetical protein
MISYRQDFLSVKMAYYKIQDLLESLHPLRCHSRTHLHFLLISPLPVSAILFDKLRHHFPPACSITLQSKLSGFHYHWKQEMGNIKFLLLFLRRREKNKQKYDISNLDGGQFVTRDLEGVFYWNLDFGWRQVKREDWAAYPTPVMAGGLFSIRQSSSQSVTIPPAVENDIFTSRAPHKTLPYLFVFFALIVYTVVCHFNLKFPVVFPLSSGFCIISLYL